MKKGKLIAVEGISGSGKTTLVKELEKNFNSDKIIFLGGFNIKYNSSELTKLCNKLIKQNLFFNMPWIVELHLLIAEMLFDIKTVVKSALLENKTIIYDNYWESIFIFQAAIMQSKPSKSFDQCIKHVELMKTNIESIIKIPKPDVIIFVDSPVDCTRERIYKRDNIFIPSNFENIQIKILELYNKYIKGTNIQYINNNKDIQSFKSKIEDIFLKEGEII